MDFLQGDGFQPDWLINPGEYEQPFHTQQGHATAYTTGVNEVQSTALYTYDSINEVVLLIHTHCMQYVS